MSCCGTAKDSRRPIDEHDDISHKVTPFLVAQQPSTSPSMTWPTRVPPVLHNGSISPIPDAHFGVEHPTLPPWQSSNNRMSPPPGASMPMMTPSLSSRTTSFHQPSAGFNNYSELLLPGIAHNRSLSIGVTPPPPILPPSTQVAMDNGKLVVSVDFGTTMSGVAYGSPRIAGGKVQQVLNWPGTQETYRKIPTCLIYDKYGNVIAWGIEAKNSGTIPETFRCEWFKLYLEPAALRNEGRMDTDLPPLPPGKGVTDVIKDFLSRLWDHARRQISIVTSAIADLDSAEVWLTVPAAWDAAGCNHMREAAIQAGMVQSSHAGDRDWRERLRIITEPEAAAVHCAYMTDLHKLKNNQNFMICDAGGGTVDLAVYKVIGNLAHLEIAEMCARSGANCGSIFLDLRFKELVNTLLAGHPTHLDAASLANFMHLFSEGEKLSYGGERDDDQEFSFTCFNPGDPHDPATGLINGDLVIPGNVLRREVFDPVVKQVLALIEAQAASITEPIDALLLVGGFSGSEYLFKRVDELFLGRIKIIGRPPDADTATLRGAAQYGLARRPLVSSVIAPRSYIMKVKLPAEPEDHQRRPAYIRDNDAGVQICENRLQYLVAKGAILRKGQLLKSKFCKFSANAADRIFVADLYTSDSDRIMRYSDEGETQELCKWTVDLGTLPTFVQYSGMHLPNGFYTDFELGLELDSAEVRGVLLHQGQEWGRVVFDFIS